MLVIIKGVIDSEILYPSIWFRFDSNYIFDRIVNKNILSISET